MQNFIVKPIGKIHINGEEMFLKLNDKYIPALEGLNEFGYIQVLWWFDKCDNENSRLKLTEKSPYVNSPEILGTFCDTFTGKTKSYCIILFVYYIY